MNPTPTLSRYMARIYILNFLAITSVLLGIIYLFDTVELLRRASKNENISVGFILQLGLFKLPEVGQILLPFAVLFSAMFTFWQLTRRYELVVVRAAGFSIWQMLMPIALVGLCVGILQITIINPIGALLIGRFNQLEQVYLKNQDDQIAIFNEGLWLRQSSDLGQNGYVILHAKRIEQTSWTLQDISAFYFDDEDNFLQRLNAKTAILETGQWLFKDVHIFKHDRTEVKISSGTLPTHLTIKDVEDSFSSPEAISFWRLPSHVKTLEQTGFDASRLKVHYQNLLSQPLLFAAMILLAASVSIRPPRSKDTMLFIAVGVFLGFFVFFMSSFLQALGASQQIPVILAAWSPSIITLLLGLTVLMNLEDG